MHEVHCRNGTLVISEDADDGDRIIVEPTINTFSPVRGTLHCVCGAPLEPWSVRCTAADSAELSCHRCHRVLGTIGLGVNTYR
jgi:hypothetical protein